MSELTITKDQLQKLFPNPSGYKLFLHVVDLAERSAEIITFLKDATDAFAEDSFAQDSEDSQ